MKIGRFRCSCLRTVTELWLHSAKKSLPLNKLPFNTSKNWLSFSNQSKVVVLYMMVHKIRITAPLLSLICQNQLQHLYNYLIFQIFFFFFKKNKYLMHIVYTYIILTLIFSDASLLYKEEKKLRTESQLYAIL
jgi:hypothetical protein